MSKLDKNKSDIYGVVVMEVNLEKQTITKWSYMGPEKEIKLLKNVKVITSHLVIKKIT